MADEDEDQPSSVALINAPSATERIGRSFTPATANRPSSVAFIDQPPSQSGRRSAFTPAGPDGANDSTGAVFSKPGTAERPSSVLLIDEPAGRKLRPRTVTLVDPRNEKREKQTDRNDQTEPKMPPELEEERMGQSLDEDVDVKEQQVKDQLQRELQAVAKKSADKDKEIVHHEYHPMDEEPAARVATAGPKSKPGTARDSRSRGRSQQKSRGIPGTIGILWKEVYRPVVAPTTADNGYRHVLCVTSIVPGGAAEATGRVKMGDKLVAVQDTGQRNRKVVVGLKKDDIRRALHGDAGLAISLELLRATDMGAKKAFLVNLVRTPKVRAELVNDTRLPQIGKNNQVPPTPSIKQTGWARGVRLRGDLAPGDGDLKEYHSLSEEEGGNASMSGEEDENGLSGEQARLKKLKKLKVSDKLTKKELEQLEVMKKHKQQLDEESDKHAMREVYLVAAIHACEEELLKARELFCDVARRATGNPLDPPKCTHKNHGAVHSLQTCMQEFRPIIDSFLTKIEEAPAYLPPTIAIERTKEEQEQQWTKETARELRDVTAALQAAEERQEKRVAEMAGELAALSLQYDEEKASMKAQTDEAIAALLAKIQLRDTEIQELKVQCEDMRDELDGVVELKDVEEIRLRLLEAEAAGGDSDENQLKKVEILKLACRAAGLNQDSLQEALKDAAVRAQIELLKKHEAELEAEVDKLRASEDALNEDQKLHRRFKWSVMINVSKVDPDDVKTEESRQKAAQVQDDEIVRAVQDYVEAAPDEAEIFVRNINDYVHVRFPFLELSAEHKKLIADTFEDIFKEVPPPSEQALKDLERQRLEDEAIDYGYENKETTGRTAGQLRTMIADAKTATRAEKDADRKRREASWEDGSGDDKEPVDSDDSDAVYQSDNPKDDDEEEHD